MICISELLIKEKNIMLQVHLPGHGKHGHPYNEDNELCAASGGC
jgi:hypothetical protein